MPTTKIHIEGQVQGVGFRPHVYQLAHRFGLKGWVSNGVDGVHIEVCGNENSILAFYEELLSAPPQNAVIKKASIQKKTDKAFPDFQIIKSKSAGKPNLLITPDLGICDACKSELWDINNRRYQYPFITCLNCGPRYSIVKGLPYDRPLTTMQKFVMCESCETEYYDTEGIRFYSQTNSCPECPVSLSWLDRTGKNLSNDSKEIIEKAIEALHKGKIVAVKGIGGFLLITDATNESSLKKLRKRKSRPSKPFALLYQNKEALEADVFVTKSKLKTWLSIESPIVLFRLKPDPKSGIAHKLIAPGLDSIGIMQPYAPVLELLTTKFGKPLVATSGNISGFPIFCNNEVAVKNLDNVADYFIVNDRSIVVPQDDSVVGYSEKRNQRVVFRRSRGYAPNYFNAEFKTEDRDVLCMGAMLKSTFSIQHSGNVYISQYIGDTMSYDVQSAYKKVLRHLMNILQFQPEYIITDKHPDYFTTQHGALLSEKFDVPVISVQHHKAHFAAVLAENNLLHSGEPVLGVIWDGTGFGDDGNIWGGEFFTFEHNELHRTAHFDYFRHLAGDKMAKEPRLSAFSLASQIPGAEDILPQKFSKIEWDLYTKYLSNWEGLKTSSIGRLFDGIASLLDICDHQSFEGEAAMKLQAIAQKYDREANGKLEPYPVTALSTRQIVEGVINDLNCQVPKEEIAVKFHLTLTKLIREVAEKSKSNKIAFSGGVFQNTLLIDMIIEEMQNDFDLFFHQQLSPNDENVAFGQLALATLILDQQKSKDHKVINLTTYSEGVK